MKRGEANAGMQNEKKKNEDDEQEMAKKWKTAKEVKTQPKKRFIKQLRYKELKKSFANKIMRKRKTFPCEK